MSDLGGEMEARDFGGDMEGGDNDVAGEFGCGWAGRVWALETIEGVLPSPSGSTPPGTPPEHPPK